MPTPWKRTARAVAFRQQNAFSTPPGWSRFQVAADSAPIGPQMRSASRSANDLPVTRVSAMPSNCVSMLR